MKRPRTTRITALALGLLAGGCAVDQNREIAEYRAITDLPPAATQPGGGLALSDALLIANQNNETLASRGEQYLRALIQRRRTVANFLPTFELGGDYRRRDPVSSSGGSSDGGSSEGGSSSSSSSQNRTFDVTGTLNWELFNGFRDANAYWRDTFVIEQRRNDMLDFQEGLLLDTASVYYRAIRGEAAIRVLESSLKVQEERLRDARGRLQARVGRPLDVAQTEAQVAATRTTLINARLDAARARTLLSLLTNLPAERVALTDLFEPPEQLESLEAYLESARRGRRDLAAAEAAVGAARRDVEVAFGQYYPSVSLDFNAFFRRDTAPTARDWDALLAINLPIFSAGRIEADVREAWSFAREAVYVRSYLDRQVVQQVTDAYEDVVASRERLASLRVQLAAAEQAFAQAEGLYQVGNATNLERVVAQDAFLDAQLQVATEEFDRKVRYLTLLRSVGGLRAELQRQAESPRPTTVPATQPDLPPNVTQPTTLPRSSAGLSP